MSAMNMNNGEADEDDENPWPGDCAPGTPHSRSNPPSQLKKNRKTTVGLDKSVAEFAGRGMVALSEIPAGTLLMAAKAFAFEVTLGGPLMILSSALKGRWSHLSRTPRANDAFNVY